MASQAFTITVDVDTLMTDFIPKMARQLIAVRNPSEDLAGTELTLTADISDERYSFRIKDGHKFDAQKGNLENPMVFLSLTVDDMAKLADMQNIDMLLGAQSQMGSDSALAERYNTLSNLQGTCVYKLTHPDGEESTITATFNGAQTPAVTLKLKMEDARELTAGKESPVQAFMAGKLQIEGEMGFAMALQPLFT